MADSAGNRVCTSTITCFSMELNTSNRSHDAAALGIGVPTGIAESESLDRFLTQSDPGTRKLYLYGPRAKMAVPRARRGRTAARNYSGYIRVSQPAAGPYAGGTPSPRSTSKRSRAGGPRSESRTDALAGVER